MTPEMPRNPMDEDERRQLRRLIRRWPSNVAEAERAFVEHSSLAAAFLVHLVVWAAVLMVPPHVPMHTVPSAAPATQIFEVERRVTVAAEDKEEPQPPKVEPPKVEPPKVEPPKVQVVKYEPPPPETPRVQPESPQRVVKRPKKKRVRKRKRTVKRTAYTAPVKPAVKEITSPDARAAGGPQVAEAVPATDAMATREEEDAPPAAPNAVPGPKVAAPEVDVDAVYRGYIGSVSRAVHRTYNYPKAAVRLRIEGKVVIELVIDNAGHIVSTRIATSSGHAVLDRAALKAVAALRGLPKPPAELKWTKRSMMVPFEYTMKRHG